MTNQRTQVSTASGRYPQFLNVDYSYYTHAVPLGVTGSLRENIGLYMITPMFTFRSDLRFLYNRDIRSQKTRRILR